MKLGWENIIDAHKGKIGLAIATGPSAKPYIKEFEYISENKKDKYCILSVNDYDCMTKLNSDYRVVANSVFTVANHYGRFNNSKSILLYADTADRTDRDFIEKNLTATYFPYDQRHFNLSVCPTIIDCCRMIIPGRKTIQETLQDYTKYKDRYSYGATVSLHMLSFAILMGCQTIFVSGVDLDYKKGYVDGTSQNNDTFAQYMSEILNDFKIITESARNIGIDVYSCCEGSPINNVIEYKPFVDLL